MPKKRRRGKPITIYATDPDIFRTARTLAEMHHLSLSHVIQSLLQGWISRIDVYGKD